MFLQTNNDAISQDDENLKSNFCHQHVDDVSLDLFICSRHDEQLLVKGFTNSLAKKHHNMKDRVVSIFD